jgi:hypothetical protein
MEGSSWELYFWFDTERSGAYIDTRWWSGPINFRAAKVQSFFLFIIHNIFRRVQVSSGRLRIDNFTFLQIDIARSFWKPVT